jgi:hypothetical protein
MAESSASCPYCRKALAKKPKRKTKCPHCSKPIYVREGKLLTEAQLKAVEEKKPPKKKAAGGKDSKSKTARDKARPARPDSPGTQPTMPDAKPAPAKPSGKKPVPTKPAESKPEEPKKKKGSSELEKDLVKFAGEVYKKAELNGGKKKLIQVVGIMVLGGVILAALTSITPQAGRRVKPKTMATILLKLANAYLDFGEAERKQLRAVINWIKNGFNLEDRIVD